MQAEKPQLCLCCEDNILVLKKTGHLEKEKHIVSMENF